MVGSRVLHNKTLIAVHSLEHGGLFDLPGTDVSPFLLGFGVILLGIRWSPSGFPTFGELLKERSFEGGGLWAS